MPALRSFCINAMAGILMLFILEVTFFVALTVLDERRKENRQVMCCIRKGADWTPPSFSQRELLKLFFERYYGPFLLKTPVKVLVLALTATFVGVNAWGIMQLEQNFDPNWYLKEHSYPSQFFDAMKAHFPENGERASIYTGESSQFERHALQSGKSPEKRCCAPFADRSALLILVFVRFSLRDRPHRLYRPAGRAEPNGATVAGEPVHPPQFGHLLVR